MATPPDFIHLLRVDLHPIPRDEATGEPRDLGLVQMIPLVRRATEEAIDALLPHQQPQLRRIALQYLIAENAAKFALRTDWVR